MPMHSPREVESMGFASIGEDVQISNRASIYGASRIHIGNHVRIDDFCVISAGKGGIDIGSYVHIAAFSSLIGAETISLADYSGLSSRVSIYSSSDDYSGSFMTNPTVPARYTGVTSAPVRIERHVIIGSGSVVLPGVTISEGAAVGALCLVYKNCDAFTVYSGNPARRVGDRKRDLLRLEQELLSEMPKSSSY